MSLQIRSACSGAVGVARFGECLLRTLGFTDEEGCVSVTKSTNNNYTLQAAPNSSILLKHPPACPMVHLSGAEQTELQSSSPQKSVRLAVCVILESSDEHVLLTQRAHHLHSFPGLWVPPGGHVESGEELLDAGLRELKEETGVVITGDGGEVLGCWESVYPPVLSWGSPRRQHFIVYYHCVSSHTHHQMELKLDPDEVHGATWLEPAVLEAILRDEPSQHQLHVLTSDNKREVISTQELRSSNVNSSNRLTTGTRYALQLWLNIRKNRDNLVRNKM